MATEIGELPTKTSYSAMSSYLRCGRQYFLEKVQRVTRRPGWYLVGGTVAHAWTEFPDRGIEAPDIREMFLAAVVEEEERSGVARDGWSAGGRATKANPAKESEEWWLEELPKMAQRWVDWRQKTGWEIWKTPDGRLGIELDGEVNLGSEVIRSHIDRVFILPSKKKQIIVPLDLKFGSRVPDQSMQLGIYSAVLSIQYGIQCRYGYYWMGRSGDHGKPIDLSVWSPALLTDLYAQFQRGRDAGVFLPNPSGMCKSCSVARFCVVGQGAEAEGVDPLAELSQVPF